MGLGLTPLPLAIFYWDRDIFGGTWSKEQGKKAFGPLGTRRCWNLGARSERAPGRGRRAGRKLFDCLMEIARDEK